MSSTGIEVGGARERTRSDREPALARLTTASLGLWPFIELARRHGVDLDQFCDEADVALSALRDAGTRFSQADCNRVAEVACAQFGDDAAMAASLTVEAGQFALLELLARTAPTVAHGLAQGCRFFPLLHDGGQLKHERLANGGHALRWYPPEGYVVHRAYVELTFGVSIRGIQRETGKEKLFPSEVWFRHAAPNDRSLYPRVLGKNVRFGMPYDQMTLSAAAAALPLSRHNTEIHKVATALATDLLTDD
jgi:hypothetical protein